MAQGPRLHQGGVRLGGRVRLYAGAVRQRLGHARRGALEDMRDTQGKLVLTAPGSKGQPAQHPSWKTYVEAARIMDTTALHAFDGRLERLVWRELDLHPADRSARGGDAQSRVKAGPRTCLARTCRLQLEASAHPFCPERRASARARAQCGRHQFAKLADRHGEPGCDPWRADIEGAAAEVAFAKALRLYWAPSEGAQEGASGDVAGWEVRRQIPRRWPIAPRE